MNITRALKRAKNVCIFVHTSPDADCVASSLTVAFALQKSGRRAAIFTDDIVSFTEIKSRILSLLPSTSGVEAVSVLQSLSLCEFIKENPLLLIVDCSDFSRIGYLKEDVFSTFGEEYISKNLAIIDHHINPSVPKSINYIDDKCSSCSELCYRVLVKAFRMKKDIILARIAFFGIAGDTGFFKFLRPGKKSAGTLSLCAKMTRVGIEPSLTSSVICKKTTHDYNTYFANLLANTKYIPHEGYDIALVEDNLEYFERFGKQNRPSGALFDILFATEGVGVIIFVKYSSCTSTECSVRVSASATFKANEFCAKFSGGGHEKAAGFKIDKPFSEILSDIKEIIL